MSPELPAAVEKTEQQPAIVKSDARIERNQNVEKQSWQIQSLNPDGS